MCPSSQRNSVLMESSALEIVTKLCDSDFTRKAKAADFIGQTWDTFVENGAGDGKDKVSPAPVYLALSKVLSDFRPYSGIFLGTRC